MTHCVLRSLAFAGIVSFTLLGSLAARAGIMAYEGFDYPPGTSLTNASQLGPGNSFGWSGRWTGVNVSFATNAANSLVYIDAGGTALLTGGGKVVVGVPSGTTVNAQPSRSFNFGGLIGNVYSGLTNAPGTYWVSFLMQWVGPVTANSPTNLYVRKGDLTFRQGAQTNATSAGAALFAVGSPNAANRIGAPLDTWSTWSGNDTNAGVLNTGFAASSVSLANVTFVLMRLDLDGVSGNDTVYTWFNWTNLNLEPSISTANTTNNTSNEDGLNNIRLDANGGNGAGTNTVLAFDEFRFGTTFADVAPAGSSFVISILPASQVVTIGTPTIIAVNANGAPPLFYYWYFNTNTLLTDQTNASLIISNTQLSHAGSYFVVVSNSINSATSSVATVTVVPPQSPQITVEPQDTTNAVGFTAAFSVIATGTAPLRYQWYFNTNTLLLNRTNATLSFIIGQTNDAGGYSVIVSNNYDSATSRVARLTVTSPSVSQLPAFPGAEGAAKLVTGGRGGIVYHVTKLDRNFNHNEAGTLRYGLTDANFPNAPRTIVFDVAGVFWLGRYGAESNYDNGWNAGQSRYNLSGNTTIAGQTAPGPVIIMGGVTKAGSGNTIIRNVMFAPGYGMQGFHEPPTPPTPGDFPDSYVYDALDISGHDILMDHLTTMYITDESISCNELAYNLTVQNCNISQGQNYPQADAEATSTTYTGHALAHLLQAGSNAKISILNNLYAHMRGRLPRVGSEVGTGAFNDFRNNVFYNWDGTAGSGGGSTQPSYDNFINNFYLAGPGGDGPVGGVNSNIVFKPGGTDIFGGSSVTYAYVSGNLRDINKDGDPNDTSSADPNYVSIVSQPAAFDVNIGLTLSARDAFTNVLRHVGSRWWERPYDFRIGNSGAINTNDIGVYVNERLIYETVTGTGKIIAWADDPFNDDPNEGVEWRSLLALRADINTFAAPFNRPPGWDTDQDGMPDYWELEHGLNPNVADQNGDFDNDGYSNLEEYLNEIAAWPAPGNVLFTGDNNSRYAEVFNWRVSGQQVNITNLGNVTTFSFWQPSAYDTAVVSNKTVLVDSVGQHAGTLRLTTNARLNLTNGWLNVADKFDIGSTCTAAVTLGNLTVASNLVNNGTLRLIGQASLTIGGTFTNNGTLDIMSWNGTLPAGLVNNGTILDRSLIVITSAHVNGSAFDVAIQGYDGHAYRLQYRDQLNSGTWLDIGATVNGNNAPIVLTHSGGATAGQRFYRVVVDP